MVQRADRVAPVRPPHCTWFADGELNVSYNCLDQQVERRARRPGRLPLHRSRQRGDDRRDHLRRAQGRGVPLANALRDPRRGQGRPGRHLPGHDPGAADRDAGLRPPRRPARGGLRRLLGRVAGRAHASTRAQGAHHPGRPGARASVLPLKEIADQAVQQARPSRRSWCSRRTGNEVADAAGPRHLVARPGRGPADGVRAGALQRRGHPLPAAHLRYDRPSRRRRSTAAAATWPTSRSPTSGSSTSTTTTSGGARPTSAG